MKGAGRFFYCRFAGIFRGPLLLLAPIGIPKRERRKQRSALPVSPEAVIRVGPDSP